ncbi:MAG TPA: hypothetical protein HPP97_16145 [Desulfuromonadales bacterium]|nr:hypothetical protein [Desulfuromonadales bacterium]
MQIRRVNPRFECSKKGTVDWNGVSYPGTVTNLSFAGGDMHLCTRIDGEFPGVGVDDECGLRLLEENNPYPFRYIAKVIRVAAPEMVLSILGMHRHF